MSMCRVIPCVVGGGCLLWLVCSFVKTLLVFALLHSVLQGQICLLLQVSLDFLLLHSSPLWWKGHCFGVLILEDLVGLHRMVQLQLLWHYWLGHRLGLLWYWMACLGNDQRSFCHFWDYTEVVYFGLFCLFCDSFVIISLLWLYLFCDSPETAAQFKPLQLTSVCSKILGSPHLQCTLWGCFPNFRVLQDRPRVFVQHVYFGAAPHTCWLWFLWLF